MQAPDRGSDPRRRGRRRWFAGTRRTCATVLVAGAGLVFASGLQAKTARHQVKCGAGYVRGSVRVPERRHGRIVRRHGKIVYTRVQRCLKVTKPKTSPPAFPPVVPTTTTAAPPSPFAPIVAPSPPPPPPLSPTDPVAVAVGDIACPAGDTTNSCKQLATETLARSQNPNAVFVLGDNQYNSGLFSEYESSGAYNDSWGVFGCALCMNPSIVHPVPGNHEYAMSSTAARYFQYFGQAIANPDNTPGGYYSFNIGTWHIIALNSDCADSGCADSDAGTTTAAQVTWLTQDLATDHSDCTLAM
jgi:hypothetical protein